EDEVQNLSKSSKSATSNVITEVVVGGNDEVTLDLSKSLLNGVGKDASSRQPLSENFANTTSNHRGKRDRSGSGTAEDLSIPSAKRRAYANGDRNNEASDSDEADSGQLKDERPISLTAEDVDDDAAE